MEGSVGSVGGRERVVSSAGASVGVFDRRSFRAIRQSPDDAHIIDDCGLNGRLRIESVFVIATATLSETGRQKVAAS